MVTIDFQKSQICNLHYLLLDRQTAVVDKSLGIDTNPSTCPYTKEITSSHPHFYHPLPLQYRVRSSTTLFLSFNIRLCINW